MKEKVDCENCRMSNEVLFKDRDQMKVVVFPNKESAFKAIKNMKRRSHYSLNEIFEVVPLGKKESSQYV